MVILGSKSVWASLQRLSFVNELNMGGDDSLYIKIYADYSAKKIVSFGIDSPSGESYYKHIKKTTEEHPNLSQVIINEEIMFRLIRNYFLGRKYKVSDLKVDVDNKKQDYNNLLESMKKDRAYILLLLEKIERDVYQGNGMLLEIEFSSEEKKLSFKSNGIIKYNEISYEDINDALTIVKDYLFSTDELAR